MHISVVQRDVLDAKIVRHVQLFDHFLVVAKLRIKVGIRGKRKSEMVRQELASKKLRWQLQTGIH